MGTVATHVRRRIAAQPARRGGFTLIEVLIVTVVLGLLTAVVIPSFLGTKERASGATAEQLLRVGATAMETAAVEPGGYATLTTGTLQAIEPVLSWQSAAGAAATRAEVTLSGVGGSGYTLSTSTPSGVVYVFTKDLAATPTVTRTCGPDCTW